MVHNEKVILKQKPLSDEGVEGLLGKVSGVEVIAIVKACLSGLFEE